MGWMDQLQPASFRGVTFQVDTATDYIGREKVLRDYPFQDKPTVQDVGSASRKGTFSAYVFGENAFDRRDDLVRALDKPGPGDLVHPWMGVKRVEILGPVPMRHSTAEGGVVRFDIEFVLADATRYPKATRNTARTVQGHVLLAQVKALEDFAKRFSVDGLTNWATDSSLLAIQRAVSAITGTINGLLTKPEGVIPFETQTRLFSQSLSELIKTPDKVAQGLMGLITGLSAIDNHFVSGRSASVSTGMSGSQKDKRDSAGFNDSLLRYQSLFNWSSGYQPSPFATPTRAREAANHLAVENLVQTGSLLSVAEIISTTDFTAHWNYVEAMAWRSTLNAQFQQQLSVADSSVYQDLLNAMTAVSNDLVTRSRHLGRVTTIQTSSVPMPALLVSYEQYGTLDYADEIVSNNQISNPLFIEPGSKLEVISHA